MKKPSLVRVTAETVQTGGTNWALMDRLTDAEIEASVAGDPDWEEFKDVDWSKAVWVMPEGSNAPEPGATRPGTRELARQPLPGPVTRRKSG